MMRRRHALSVAVVVDQESIHYQATPLHLPTQPPEAEVVLEQGVGAAGVNLELTQGHREAAGGRTW